MKERAQENTGDEYRPRTRSQTATWKNGQVILDGPADWPEGCKLRVAAISTPAEPIGIPDDQWPRDPQGIAELLKRMDQIEPFDMTPAEEVGLGGLETEARRVRAGQVRQAN